MILCGLASSSLKQFSYFILYTHMWVLSWVLETVWILLKMDYIIYDRSHIHKLFNGFQIFCMDLVN